MNLRHVTLTVVAAFSLLMGGCVSSGKYEIKEREAASLGADLADLRGKYATLVAERDDLVKAVAGLKGEIAGLTRDKEKLNADNRELGETLKGKTDTMSKNISDLRQKVAELESDNARLKKEIEGLRKAKEEKVKEVSSTYEQLMDKMKNEIAQGQVTISELKGKLTVNMVDAILFDLGKAEVKPEGVLILQKVVDILKGVKDKAIRIEGHTDNNPITGNLARKYPTNWELSAARAINVTRYLQSQGIDPLNLASVAYGEYKPVADNATSEGQAKNRRIEIILVAREEPLFTPPAAPATPAQ